MIHTSRQLLAFFFLAALASGVQAHANHEGHAGHAHQASSPASTAKLDGVRVEDCWIRSMPANLPSAGYFIVHNQRGDDVALTGIATDAYAQTMLHQTVTQSGMAKMVHTDAVDVPAGGRLEFVPGGYHAMLEQPTRSLKVGDALTIAFQFGNAGQVSAECVLQAPGSLGKAAHH